ncbi:MAG: glutaredoxin [Erysipelotrichaceae bacterium]|nr:glutaredoxin [Erysipelotrichaceae bacterium]
MLKVYGSEMCPDCRDCEFNFELYHIEYEYIDINKSLRDLKIFLHYRDNDPVFDAAKQGGSIGIPAIVKEDGTITQDWAGVVKEYGNEPIYKETGPVCSIDGKNC